MYMPNYLEELYCHNDVFSQFSGSKCTIMVLESMTKQLTVDQQEEWENYLTANNNSAAAQHCCIDEDKIQI